MCVHRESGAQRAVKVLRKSHMDDDEKRMLFNEINVVAQMSCICSFRGIANHCAEALFRILYVGLVVTPNSIAKTFVAKGIRKLPLLFFCNVFDDIDHVVVEGLLLS